MTAPAAEKAVRPVIEALSAATNETCDSHLAASAAYVVLYANGHTLSFCRHCAVKHFGDNLPPSYLDKKELPCSS